MDNLLEDGEISNDSDCYTPLKRPDNYSTFSNVKITPQVTVNESDSPPDNSSSDSGSDSDCAIKVKRPKLKPRLKQSRTNPVNNKYNIWSTRMQEEVLVDTLNTCDVTKKDRSRDVETYDYPIRDDYSENDSCDLRNLLTRKNKRVNRDKWNKEDKRTKDLLGKEIKKDKNVRDNKKDEEKTRKNNKRTKDDRKNKDLRLVREKQENEDARGTPRHLIDLSVTTENTEEEIARDLANKLFETKEELLVKIVSIIGKEKALKIFKDVKRIEKEGGMLIMNQSRRRTPGGVYLFLVRHEDDLTQEQRTKIFEEDKQKSKNEERANRKKRFSKIKLSNAFGKDIPDLLTRGKLGIESIVEKRWVNEKSETEHDEVENPPPTPETDSLENIEDCAINPQENKPLIDVTSGRQTQEYDEDFLDLGSANDMDLF